MTTELMFLRRLDLGEDADDRAIRRAYARELKQIDQEADPTGFQDLREAYEAALYWARHHDEHPAPPLDRVPPAAIELAPDSAPPQPEQLDTDHDALASAVFADFLQRAAGITDERPVTADAPWQRVLRTSLDDPRLVNIIARETFERRVAELLASGWRPGHEALLVAAVKVFGWSGDRRRVFGLGRAGMMLDAAIDERATFDLQPDAQQEQQRRLIERLRDPKPPGTRELVLNSATLETLIARFPTWLALITSVEHIVRWRERNEKLPTWRRKLTFTGLRAPAEPSYEKQASGGFSWSWLIVLALIAVVRFAAHDGGGGAKPAKPDESTRYFNLGTQQLNEGDPKPAIANFTRALALKPNDASTYANRAAAYVNAGDDQAAAADFDQLATLNPSSPILYRGRGVLAMRAGRYAEAIADFTKALSLEPNYGFTLMRRAEAYEKLGKPDLALADVDAALRVDKQPGASPYLLRMKIFAARGDHDQAVAQIEPMLAANPASAYAYFRAAELQARLGQPAKAMALLDRGVVAAADADLYLYRAQMRPAADKAGRERDIHSGLELAPHSVYGHRVRAELEFENGKPAAAVATLTTVINDPQASEPLPLALVHRGVIHLKMGNPALAQADFASARAGARTATELNNVAWELVRQNVALPSALSIATEAVAKAPDAARYIDTKAFVLLRLGRQREAIDQYDAALTLMPALPSSLYGRGVAKRRAGQTAAGDADLKAARALQPDIAAEYARMGIKP